MLRKLPLRKLKVLCFVSACVLSAYMLWSALMEVEVGYKTRNSGSFKKEILRLDADFLNEEEDKVCSKVVPFKNVSGRLSTYDLPKETDYSLGPDKSYKLPKPVLNAEETDREIQVFLVPFSHSDPGYGQTVENYYTGSTRSMYMYL